MHWIAPSEKDTDNAALEKRLWAAADQFRANSGLKAQEYSDPSLASSSCDSPKYASPAKHDYLLVQEWEWKRTAELSDKYQPSLSEKRLNEVGL